ncbi:MULTISPECIES: hypothetical protein [Pseudomonas]|nr:MULTISPECIES: hypothetical protein [Pseudomonas]MCA4077655.1 hypothetical protein [Pseudomonas kurunegalensis]WJR58694.1 hypothetical protein LU664_012850 [Pseudomonas kurunegalensis]
MSTAYLPVTMQRLTDLSSVGLHGGVQYTANLDSRQQEASGVNLGVRWQF